MNKLSEDKFISEICIRLDHSIAALDSDVEAQLDAARATALSLDTTKAMPHQAIDDGLLLDGVVNTLEDYDDVSPEIENRLNQIRHRAIAQLSEQSTSPGSFVLFTQWLEQIRDSFYSSFNYPAGMMATACLTITVASLFYMNTGQDAIVPVDEETLLIASAEDFELYENLDFYLWLEEIEQAN